MNPPLARRPIVLVESPYAGDHAQHLAFLRACLRDSIDRGESPFAGHGLYTQPGVLDDDSPAERELGMRAAREFLRVVEKVVFYTNHGVSRGMRDGWEYAVAEAERRGVAVHDFIECRELGPRLTELAAIQAAYDRRTLAALEQLGFVGRRLPAFW
jgi:hypothetical protein